ncbi:MAG: DNA cytosine methyltransferase [Eubacteriales bacterium]
MKHLFVDNFAGGGGASTGIEMAIGRSVDIAINHDPDAIAMHKANHPATRHYCEDVWQVDPVEACGGNPVALAWFSPDCKHFSRAKGGKPVDKHIRGLAWVAIRWTYAVRPKVIMLENVPEIQTWGPLGADGKPIKERAGETFAGFILALTSGIPETHPAYKEMCDALSVSPTSQMAQTLQKGLGYKVQYRTLKSCDYGAPTTRTRFYLIARCDGCPIVWAEPTHAPKDSEDVKTGKKKPYRTAAECIDWSIPAQSIFERNKPLADNTMRRIARGIQKFVIDNPEPFIINYKFENSPRSSEKTLSTVTSVNNHYLVAPTMIPIGYGERNGQEPRVNSVDKPLGTIVTSGKHYCVEAYIMTMRRNMDGQNADEPLTTISCSGAHHAEVQALLYKYPSPITSKKARLDVVTIHGEEYIITDIRMRMLQPRELFNAQGFPADYIIDTDADGNPYPKSKQVARCGNSVTPQVPAALVRANLSEECTDRCDNKEEP